MPQTTRHRYEVEVRADLSQTGSSPQQLAAFEGTVRRSAEAMRHRPMLAPAWVQASDVEVTADVRAVTSPHLSIRVTMDCSDRAVERVVQSALDEMWRGRHVLGTGAVPELAAAVSISGQPTIVSVLTVSPARRAALAVGDAVVLGGALAAYGLSAVGNQLSTATPALSHRVNSLVHAGTVRRGQSH